MRSLSLALCATALTAGAAALAQKDKDSREGFNDIGFVKSAYSAGLHEERVGKLAAMKSGSGPVRRLGEKIAADHAAANEGLIRLAATLKTELPSGPEKLQKDELGRLSKLEGKAFDLAFARHLIDGHEKSIKAFEEARKESRQKDVRDFAEKQLPTLREHLREAKLLGAVPARGSGEGR